jgi:hypothetical protein
MVIWERLLTRKQEDKWLQERPFQEPHIPPYHEPYVHQEMPDEVRQERIAQYWAFRRGEFISGLQFIQDLAVASEETYYHHQACRRKELGID